MEVRLVQLVHRPMCLGRFSNQVFRDRVPDGVLKLVRCPRNLAFERLIWHGGSYRSSDPINGLVNRGGKPIPIILGMV